ncbi:MAG: alpha/beta fold hydrolase [Acidobacteriota bacterium]
MLHRAPAPSFVLASFVSMSVALASFVLLPAAALAESPPSAIGAPPAPGSLFLQPERITFEDGGQVEAERGLMFVPTNRERPESGVISVEIYRFKAGPEATPGTPPVFLLHGGPGWPGLSGALERSRYYEHLLGSLASVADLVVVGQRGIGSSRPDTACRLPEDRPSENTMDRAQAVEVVKETVRDCKAFWEQQGLDLTGFNVNQAAADVDDIRRALGYKTITLWGGSFGSHWAMTLMRNHPEIVARAVLGGLEGPDHTYDMPGDVLKALERMAAAAEASPAVAPHVPKGGLIEALRTVIARAEKEPVTIEVPATDDEEARTVVLDADDLRGMTSGYTGSARSRWDVADWPTEVLELYHGDFSRAAKHVRSGIRAPTASFFMLDCGSGITPARHERVLQDPGAKVVGELGWFYDAACPIWDTDLGDAFRQNFETHIPTVLVHGNWDVSTPLENALELAPYFKAGKLIQVDGGSHGAVGEVLRDTEGFREAILKFVGTGDMSALPDQIELPPIDWKAPPAREAAAE